MRRLSSSSVDSPVRALTLSLLPPQQVQTVELQQQHGLSSLWRHAFAPCQSTSNRVFCK